MTDPFSNLCELALCAGLTYLVVALVRHTPTIDSDVRDATSFWRFNTPPGWPPAPARFVPEPGWRPDPELPTAPVGWRWWVPAGPADGVTTLEAATAWVPAFADRANH